MACVSLYRETETETQTDREGIPSERLRRYSRAFPAATVVPLAELNFHCFSLLCFRRLVEDGNMYFITPDVDLDAELERRHPGARDWRVCLTPAERGRLNEHAALLEADFGGRGQPKHNNGNSNKPNARNHKTTTTKTAINRTQETTKRRCAPLRELHAICRLHAVGHLSDSHVAAHHAHLARRKTFQCRRPC